jgi:exodeoxyribonuclease VII large subunit
MWSRVISMPPPPSQIDLFAPRPPAPEARPVPAPQVVARVEPARSPASTPPLEPASAIAPAPAAAILSVSELTFQLKGAVEARFSKVAVLGEVSNCRLQGSGHLYFTLKDDGACVAAVMWRREAQRLPFELKDGLQLVCQGRVEIYGPHGKYQLIVDRLEPVGEGALALAFEALKTKLAGEGLFAPARKRKLPFLPRCIGVVTSPTGAALRDFLRVLHLRFPGLPVLIAPARVQGEGAASEIAGALSLLAQGGEVDVVLLTRGGGSMEDLWAFNHEALARAIVASQVPVVSAVGHEIDFTIADFVADRRAPTPTAAAEILAPSRSELTTDLAKASHRISRALGAVVQMRRQTLLRLRMRLGDPRRALTERRLKLADLEDRLQVAGERQLLDRSQRLRQLSDRLQRQSPRQALGQKLLSLRALSLQLERACARAVAVGIRRAELAQLRVRLNQGAQSSLGSRSQQLRIERARLDAISPQRVFERGYSLTRAVASGEVIRFASQVHPGDAIAVTVAMRERDGELVEEQLRAQVLP